jgi:hypothetical protein
MTTKKNTPASTPAEPEADSLSIEEQKAVMQEQFKFQLKALLKSAEAMGVNLSEVYEKPPVNITVVYDSSAQTAKIQQPGDKVPLDALGGPAANAPAQLKPGQIIPGSQTWRPWSRNDLDPTATISFVPLPVPSLVFPFMDDEGRQKIRLDVNDLICWLTCGVENTINKFFYNVYENAYNQWKELEYFKRHGPAFAPWGAKGLNGEPAWQFTPLAPSFGMSEEGRSLRIGPPTILDMVPGETPEGPPGSTGGNQ